jgi:hypothetical protein
MATEQLTERESQALEHLRKAEDLEVTIAEYCRSFEIDVKELYAAKQVLVKKGLLPAPPKPAAAEEDKLSDFVAVHVVPKPSAEPVCRLRYPNGLLIECMSWPTAQWLAKLAGSLDVPA